MRTQRSTFEEESISSSDAEPHKEKKFEGGRRPLLVDTPLPSSKKLKRNEEPKVPELSREQRTMVSELVKFQEEFETYSEENLKDIKEAFPMGSSEADKAQRLRHMMEIISQEYAILKAYFTRLPGYLKIPKELRSPLLKSNLSGLLLLRWASRYRPITDSVRLLQSRPAYTRTHFRRTNHGATTDAMFELFRRLGQLDMDEEELALLHATVVYSVSPGLERPVEVEHLYRLHVRTFRDVALLKGPKRVWEMQSAINDLRCVARKLVNKNEVFCRRED